MTTRTQHDWRRFIRLYDTGMTPLYACKADQRFSYRLYVPESFNPEGAGLHPVVVDVHGTWREDHRSFFKGFCDRNNAILFAPIFPASIIEPGEMDSYKFMEHHGIRFDLLLIEMLREASARYRFDWDKLLFFGFSGGAQYVHRFLYFHPELPFAASIAAPGSVTLCDTSLGWWRGIADLKERFNRTYEPEAIKSVRIQCLVGSRDTDVSEITVKPTDRDWCEGANDAGRTRIERTRTLAKSYRAIGSDCEFLLVDGVGHEYGPLILAACSFFEAALKE